MDQALIFKPFKNLFVLRTELFSFQADKILIERKSGEIPGNIDEKIEDCEKAIDELYKLMDDYKEMKCTKSNLKFQIVYETQVNNMSVSSISSLFDITDRYVRQVRNEFKNFCLNC